MPRKPTESKLAENIAAKIINLETEARISVSKGCFDRDYILNSILQKIRQLEWMGMSTKEAWFSYYRVQEIDGNNGKEVDKRARQRTKKLDKSIT